MTSSLAALASALALAAPGQLDDCDGDGQLDAAQIAADQALDRNRDGVLDACQEEWFGRVEVIATDLADAPYVAVADLDGDGLLDVAIATGEEVSWRRNLGPGGFGVDRPLTTRPCPPRLAALDVGGDGDVDLVCWGSGCEAALLENTGAGTFGAPLPLGGTWSAVHTSDLDGDGDADLVVGDVSALSWLRNGAGGLAAAALLTPGIARDRITSTDLDGDLDPDLLTAYSPCILGGDEVRRVDNLGAGQVGAPSVILGGTLVCFPYLQTGDVDGDGDLDLLWTRRLEGPPLRWELGLRPNLVLDDCDGDGTTDRDQIARTPWMDGNGDGVLDRCEAVGGTYCTSSGGGASLLPSMVAVGSDAVEDGDLTLIARFLPQHSVGYFVASRTPGNTLPVPGSIGRLCVSGSIGRAVGGVLDSSTLGTLVAQVDLTAIPQPTGPVAVQPGETLHFQAWHRTTLAGQPTSDLTDAVRVTFE